MMTIPVGTFSAMAIGSQLTQTALDAFHVDKGSGELVTQGVPRIQEILNNSSSSHHVVYQLGPNESSVLLQQCGSANAIQETLLVHIFSNRLTNVETRPEWLDDFEAKFGPVDCHDLYQINCCIKLAIERGCTLAQILNTVTKCQGLVLVAASRLRGTEITLLLRPNCSERAQAECKMLSACASSEERQDYFVHRVVAHELTLLSVKGIAGILHCSEQRGQISIVTLLEPWQIVPYLVPDAPELCCSKAEQMRICFGLEVAICSMRNELMRIMPEILPCHISLIVAVMTCTGVIRPVNRYTMREYSNALQRISFEESTKNLVDACVRGEIDWLNSVSSCVAVSKTIR